MYKDRHRETDNDMNGYPAMGIVLLHLISEKPKQPKILTNTLLISFQNGACLDTL